MDDLSATLVESNVVVNGQASHSNPSSARVICGRSCSGICDAQGCRNAARRSENDGTARLEYAKDGVVEPLGKFKLSLSKSDAVDAKS